MKIYRTRIERIDGKFRIHPVETADLSEDLANNFQWDRIVRADFLQEDTVVIMTDKAEKMNDFRCGVELVSELNQWWDTIFSQENKDKYNQMVAEREQSSNESSNPSS